MMEKIDSIKALRDDFIKAQEKDLNFKSASEGMKLSEDANATGHLLRDRNRDISYLNKILREHERKEMLRLTQPKSLFYTDEAGRSFIDESCAKRRERKAFWGGVAVTALAAIFIAASKKKGDEE